MIPRDRLLPSLLLSHLPILKQLPRVLVVEVLRIAAQVKTSSPNQHAVLEHNRSVGLAQDGTRLRMIVVRPVSKVLEIRFLPPGMFFRRLSAPDHLSLTIYLITLRRPLARKRKADRDNVLPFFRRFRRRVLRDSVERWRNQRQHDSRSTLSPELKTGRHVVRSRPDHRPERIRDRQPNPMPLGKYPGRKVHLDVEQINLPRLK